MNQNQLKKCKQASMKPQDNVWMLRRVFFPGKNFSSNCRSENKNILLVCFSFLMNCARHSKLADCYSCFSTSLTLIL